MEEELENYRKKLAKEVKRLHQNAEHGNEDPYDMGKRHALTNVHNKIRSMQVNNS